MSLRLVLLFYMEEWSELGRRQLGLVSRRQLAALGFGSQTIWRRVGRGQWEEILPGVYSAQGVPRSWEQDVLAACLWAGDEAVASHRSAAALHAFAGFERGPIEVTALKKNQAPYPFKVYRFAPDPRFVMRKGCIPVTNPSRTIMDLASLIAPEQLERLVEEAIRRNLTSHAQLRWGIAKLLGPGRRGAGALSRLLDVRDPNRLPSVTEFQGEIGKLLRAAGLEPEEEYEIWDGGRFIARPDFVFVHERVVVEADGYATHSGRLDWEHDLARRNALTSAGWRVLHVTWSDLKSRPDEFTAEVRAALALGRGAGPPR